MRGAEENLPQQAELARWLREMNELGPRLSGTPAHRAFVDLLEERFRELGLDTVRDAFRVDLWEPTRWALSVNGADGARAIPIASPYPDAGATGPEGVTAELVHLAEATTAAAAPDRVQGRLVMVDYAIEEHPLGYTSTWGVHDPASRPVPTVSGLGAHNWLKLERLRLSLAAAGAKGLIVAWANRSDAFAAHQFQPIFPGSVRKWYGELPTAGASSGTLPALWVGPTGRERLLEAAAQAEPVTLVREAQESPDAASDTLLATLPGTGGEAIVLVTHTDGINAVQENAALGFLALAQAFAALPAAERQRDVVFVCATGHLTGTLRDAADGSPTLAESEGVLARHPELAARTVAAFGVEHLGTRDEWAHCLTPSAALADVLLASLAGTDSGPVLVADGRVWGMAFPFAEAGVPTLSYGSMPLSLMSATPGGRLEQVSVERLREELRALARAVRMVDAMATSTLRAAS